MTEQEIGIFLDLFIRDGYVLNFYDTSTFDILALRSIGIPLHTKYQKSSVKSLLIFLDSDVSSATKEKLLLDIFDYYEEQKCYEKERIATDLWGDGSAIYRNEEFGNKYDKCKAIADRIRGNAQPLAKEADYLKSEFSDSYLKQQIELMEN